MREASAWLLVEASGWLLVEATAWLLVEASGWLLCSQVLGFGALKSLPSPSLLPVEPTPSLLPQYMCMWRVKQVFVACEASFCRPKCMWHV